MSAPGERFPAIDWRAPWYGPWRERGEAVEATAQGDGLAAALNAQAPPVTFVAQSELPPGTPYESFIFDTGTCPARDNLHDFFNGLVWLAFPGAKRALNRLQATEIARDGIGGVRGRVRDAITLLDENGALLSAPPALWDALLARQWRRLFVELRPLWEDARLLVFGHALLEGLAAPRKELTAHVWCANADWSRLDDWLAQAVTRERLAAKPFTPLPVLGTPGWWAGNADFSFYDDATVFRVPRTQPRTTVPHAGPPGT